MNLLQKTTNSGHYFGTEEYTGEEKYLESPKYTVWLDELALIVPKFNLA